MKCLQRDSNQWPCDPLSHPYTPKAKLIISYVTYLKCWLLVWTRAEMVVALAVRILSCGRELGLVHVRVLTVRVRSIWTHPRLWAVGRGRQWLLWWILRFVGILLVRALGSILKQNINTFKIGYQERKNITGLDKSRYQVHGFLISPQKKICCGYSLEVPPWGTSNEYPQHMFLLRNKKTKDIFWLKKAPYQELWNITAPVKAHFFNPNVLICLLFLIDDIP